MEWMILPFKRYVDFEGRSRRKEFWMFQPLGPRDFEIPFKDLPRGAAQTQIDALDKSTSLRSPLIAGPLLDELFGHPIGIGGFG